MTPRSSEAAPGTAPAVAVESDDPAAAERFARLAGLPYALSTQAARATFTVRLRDGMVTIVPRDPNLGGGVEVDWLSPEIERRVRGGRRQLLARAVGLRRRTGLSLLDATAGFGRDGYVLAALGAHVTLCERSPLMYAVLDAARARVRRDARATARPVELIHADAGLWLPDADRRFDVIYLDPMYPHRGKTALPRAALRVLRELVGDDGDAGALLAAARANAHRRVVVKRPPAAPTLAGIAPDLAFKGKQARYDVYLAATAPGTSAASNDDV